MSTAFARFCETHDKLLQQIAVPERLWPVLFQKLRDRNWSYESALTFDSKTPDDAARPVLCNQSFELHSDIWVIKHHLTCRGTKELFNATERDPALALELYSWLTDLLELDATSTNEPTNSSSTEDAAGSDASCQLDMMSLVHSTLQQHLHRIVHAFEFQSSPTSTPTKYKYILPEAVSKMPVASDPTFALSPFLWHDPSQPGVVQPVTLMWPNSDAAAGELATRSRLEPGLPDFSSRAHWEQAYQQQRCSSEWYCQCGDVWEVLQRHCPPSSTTSVLIPGCGNSELGVQLHQQGYGSVTNADYIPEVIATMAARHPPASAPGLHWQVADCTNMAATPDGSYDVILDKATLDALLSLSPTGQGRGYRQGGAELQQVQAYLREMARVLRSSGTLLVVSLREPCVQVALLEGVAASSSCCCGDDGGRSGGGVVVQVFAGDEVPAGFDWPAGSGCSSEQQRRAQGERGGDVAAQQQQQQQQEQGLLRVVEVVEIPVAGRGMSAHVYVCRKAGTACGV